MLLSLIMALSLASAENAKPKWTTKTPKDSPSTLYFVGRSPLVDGEAEGVQSASGDVRAQIIRQEFGTEIKLDSRQSETLKEISYEARIQELSESVRLVGLKQEEIFVEPELGKFRVWMLFSVPRKSVSEERQRLAREKMARATNPSVQTEAGSKDGDVGEKPKLRKGMKKSQVIAAFGTPETAKEDQFNYKSSTFCEGDKGFYGTYYSCTIWFDKGKVDFWSRFLPGYTTDLDDEPEKQRPAVPISAAKVLSPKEFFKTHAVNSFAASAYLKTRDCKFDQNNVIKQPSSKECQKGFEDLWVFAAELSIAEGCQLTSDSKWKCPSAGSTQHPFISENISPPGQDNNWNLANLRIVASYFFVDQAVNPTPRIVRVGQKFGFYIFFGSKKANLPLRIELIPAGSPQNFPCSSCKPGEWSVSKDGKSVVVSKEIDGKAGKFGFFWGIGEGDPKGTYLLKVQLDDSYENEFKFTVK